MLVMLAAIVVAGVIAVADVPRPVAWVARAALPALVLVWLITAVSGITGRPPPPRP